ncbi:hypothetical protein SEA_SUCCESS_5 [Streptomyces phage Success]|uniref:Uncharacterized protein n=1 Tax=Streptomyces phage Success TaxID=2999013 RepID=A0A9E8S088_9CAUD|nr:hypothetical protein QEH47_gp05 [Streptomyces phage Success]WAB08792.1 hypothetical protein SEA_SUCCESS_5 [Streptomyces phage Success]
MPDHIEPPTAINHMGVELPADRSTNRAQDAFEALRELMARLDVSPSEMRVDWNTDEREVPIYVGHLSIVDVLRLNRALKAGLGRQEPPNILADRPHRPMVGETVLDTASDAMGVVKGYVLEPVDPGEEPWTAIPDDIRRPDRDRLIAARRAQIERDTRSKPALEPVEMERVVQ